MEFKVDCTPGRGVLTRCNYNWQIVREARLSGVAILRITDLNMGNLSVTNDIENVLAEMAQFLALPLDKYVIQYRDSDHEWADIKVVGREGAMQIFDCSVVPMQLPQVVPRD